MHRWRPPYLLACTGANDFFIFHRFESHHHQNPNGFFWLILFKISLKFSVPNPLANFHLCTRSPEQHENRICLAFVFVHEWFRIFETRAALKKFTKYLNLNLSFETTGNFKSSLLSRRFAEAIEFCRSSSLVDNKEFLWTIPWLMHVVLERNVRRNIIADEKHERLGVIIKSEGKSLNSFQCF